MLTFQLPLLETSPVTLFNGIGSGTTSVTLPRDCTSNSNQISLDSVGVILIDNTITLNYTVSNKNGVTTWSIYGGKINFRYATVGS